MMAVMIVVTGDDSPSNDGITNATRSATSTAVADEETIAEQQKFYISKNFSSATAMQNLSEKV